ncbi:hypothetical protein FOCC_FOCC012640 [Frankliniella occidentalis]|nr:hypothetical protein FOCC_FOCC012640 [Frankliniella occidentalis]
MASPPTVDSVTIKTKSYKTTSDESTKSGQSSSSWSRVKTWEDEECVRGVYSRDSDRAVLSVKVLSVIVQVYSAVNRVVYTNHTDPTEPKGDCRRTEYDVLYRGIANYTTVPVTGRDVNITYVVNGIRTFAVQLGHVLPICGSTGYTTENPRLFDLEKGEFGFAFDKLDDNLPENIDSLAYYESKASAIELNSMKRTSDLQMKGIYERCLTRRDLLLTKLTLARRDPDPLIKLIKGEIVRASARNTAERVQMLSADRRLCLIGRYKMYLGFLLDEVGGIGEVECPYASRNSPVGPEFQDYLEYADDGITCKLKEKHQYYTPVQGQLLVTGRDFCYFVVFTSKDLKTIRGGRSEIFISLLFADLVEFWRTAQWSDDCQKQVIVRR